jgi:hypothetical protein
MKKPTFKLPKQKHLKYLILTYMDHLIHNYKKSLIEKDSFWFLFIAHEFNGYFAYKNSSIYDL